jgi:hypothetical protein
MHSKLQKKRHSSFYGNMLSYMLRYSKFKKKKSGTLAAWTKIINIVRIIFWPLIIATDFLDKINIVKFHLYIFWQGK